MQARAMTIVEMSPRNSIGRGFERMGEEGRAWVSIDLGMTEPLFDVVDGCVLAVEFSQDGRNFRAIEFVGAE
jgi:hypothetical protein